MAAPSPKSYHLICTGLALDTVNKHQAPEDITLFGSCFCPFVQRAWAAMEALGVPYKVRNSLFISSCTRLTFTSISFSDEVDPYKKPADLLEVSPKGLVPGLKLHKYSPPRGLNESTVILEYVEDLARESTGRTLLPKDPCTRLDYRVVSILTEVPDARALVRLQCDHVNRAIVPSFYRFLQAQDPAAQITAGQEFRKAIEDLTVLLERAEKDVLGRGGVAGVGEQTALGVGLGLYGGTGQLSLTDVMVGPWLFRASNVLKHYRAFEMPEGERFRTWTTRIFENPAFKATCSTEELYLDSYERYAQNRPNTSQVANAINSGKPLP
ncbi:Glutathione transferase [Mycena chlorophos]|uniref:Glutathione transferase n=1 Tax=Mycena chlorophos TaxID=658473 RepID=A0A8H6S1G7_MYCCL|nr:Glutathione transferase [Mycena chlorophos]